MTELETTIESALIADGWSMTYVVDDPGGYLKESKFTCTIARHYRSESLQTGKAFETPFIKGSGHRRWKSQPATRAIIGPGLGSGYWNMKIKHGERVGSNDTPKLVEGNARNEEVMKEFGRITEAEAPNLCEVMYALLSDANSVRHGTTFEEYAREMGLDDDSRSAERTFNACRDVWSSLVRCGAKFEKLEELYKDY